MKLPHPTEICPLGFFKPGSSVGRSDAGVDALAIISRSFVNHLVSGSFVGPVNRQDSELDPLGLAYDNSFPSHLGRRAGC